MICDFYYLKNPSIPQGHKNILLCHFIIFFKVLPFSIKFFNTFGTFFMVCRKDIILFYFLIWKPNSCHDNNCSAFPPTELSYHLQKMPNPFYILCLVLRFLLCFTDLLIYCYTHIIASKSFNIWEVKSLACLMFLGLLSIFVVVVEYFLIFTFP